MSELTSEYFRAAAAKSSQNEAGRSQRQSAKTNTNIDDPKQFINDTVDKIKRGEKKKLKTLWIETSGCFGEIISFLNGDDPDIVYWLTEMVDCTFYASIMADQGEAAFKQIVDTVNSGEEYLLVVSGAIPLAENGNCAILGTYNGKQMTAAESVRFAASKAKMIMSVGTCACFGGPTAARPNITKAISIQEFLKRDDIINAPGCPVNPLWSFGIFAFIINYGRPPVDEEGRPLAFYSKTIHDHCPRRAYFDQQIAAMKFGEPECMFMLGCRGPITKTLCPFTRWNGSDNWPIGDNTTCIGCANKGFPDMMEPFVRYL